MSTTPTMTAPETGLPLSAPLPPREARGFAEVLPYAVGALALVALVGAGVYVYRILRRRAAPTPASAALSAIAADPSPAGVTRALRDYLAARVPALHTGLTSGEIASHAVATPTPDWPDMLRDCDAAHYAGASVDDLAVRATRLIDETEKRLREAARSR